jgi:hypothetical protein
VNIADPIQLDGQVLTRYADHLARLGSLEREDVRAGAERVVACGLERSPAWCILQARATLAALEACDPCAALREALSVHPEPDDVYLVLGAFGAISDVSERRLRQRDEVAARRRSRHAAREFGSAITRLEGRQRR